MKKDIHPEAYRDVVFKDAGADVTWLTRSTVKTDKTITWEDGNEYPLYVLEISSHSHPFYTGKQKFVDSEGRVERFQRKYSTPAANANTGKKAKRARKAERARDSK